MKVGSLVKCTVEFRCTVPYNEILPQVEMVYVVRAVDTHENTTGIQLEEIINDENFYMINGKLVKTECCFDVAHFKELQPPMEIDIEELLTIDSLV